MQEPDGAYDQAAEDLVEGRLSEQDAEGLSLAVGDDEQARAEIASALLVHGLLAGRSADPEQGLAAVKARLRDKPARPRGSDSSMRRRRLLWAAGIAALVVVAIGAILRLTSVEPVEPAAARLVSGSLEGLPPDATDIPVGQLVSTAKEPAELLCEDGSRLRLAPESGARIIGPRRVQLTAGAIRCTVPDAEQPFRVSSAVGDVITEATQFTVRLGKAGDLQGMLVSVAIGAVRVERPGQAAARVTARKLWLCPSPFRSDRVAGLALRMLFPGEPIEDVKSELEQGVLEIEGKIGEGEVEAKIAPDGTVHSYSREFSRQELPAALPEAVRGAIEAKFGTDLTWREAEVEFVGGSASYEVEVRVRGKKVEVELDSNGNFIGKEGKNRL